MCTNETIVHETVKSPERHVNEKKNRLNEKGFKILPSKGDI